MFSQLDDEHLPPRLAAPRSAPRRLSAFTLIELLIVIGMIAVLMALLLPTLNRVRQAAQAAVCASNLREIGASVFLYASNNDSCLFPQCDNGCWKNRTNPLVQIDAHDPYAYWGVAYAQYAGASKEIFNCPSALATDTGGADGALQDGNRYVCFGLNGYAGEWSVSEITDAMRKQIFGNPGLCALYTRITTSLWVGRPITSVRKPAQLILAQDAYEAVLDGNGDVFVNWYQWTPPQFPVDESFESLRHSNAGNAVFLDGHVEPLTRIQQSDVRYYTGMW